MDLEPLKPITKPQLEGAAAAHLLRETTSALRTLVQTINISFCWFLSSTSVSIILPSFTGLADNLADICVCKKGLLLISLPLQVLSRDLFVLFVVVVVLFFFLMEVAG